ncbi:two-component system, response regulator YesN [Paenibacillus sp. UNC496MF]|uniref:response regulator n=1 Tax=Paenibacillus sp. UNC496MF TaxID=1502753 RepID=UPI0008EEFB83|nr:response regulator [Paenibacillus sp. UNC496MF]SFI51000.1 two-component system, response regulator YesN [Paenibacillus sp. UNC496MF]
MYSILLVDDEKMELDTLSRYVPWDAMDIAVAGTAKNGREALELAKALDPDVILTDVRMPIMDGLEFAKRAKQHSKRVKIVFLSGHDEFQYIKAAIAVEASGYLLKPIDLDELRQLMEKVKLKCDEARLAEQTIAMAKEKLLRALFLEPGDDAREEAAAKLLRMDGMPELLRGPLKVASLSVAWIGDDGGSASGEQAPKQLEASLTEAVRARLKALGFAGGLIDGEYGDFAALFPAADPRNDDALWTGLQREMAESFPVRLTIGLSRPGERPEDAYALLKEARAAAEHAFYVGKGALIRAEAVREPSTGEVGVEAYQAALLRAIGQLKPDEAEREIDRFMEELKTRRVHRHPARAAAVRLLSGVKHQLGQAVKDAEAAGPVRGEWDLMNGCEVLGDIGDYLKQACGSLILVLSEKDRDRHLGIARSIEAIIARDYRLPLTVEDIAKEVYLSPNYVRTIFKEKTGRTILEAITDMRMARASALLADRSLKIHEIAGRVGYENVSYFCSLFHKTAGVTPNQYRKQFY